MIESLNDLLVQPGIKKAMKVPFVSRNLDQFKVFLDSFVCGSINRISKRLQLFFSLKTLILINLIPIAYLAGKMNAISLSNWIDVIFRAHIWFPGTIVINIIYLLGRYTRDILAIALRIVGIVVAIWALYKFFLWICKKFSEQPDVKRT